MPKREANPASPVTAHSDLVSLVPLLTVHLPDTRPLSRCHGCHAHSKTRGHAARCHSATAEASLCWCTLPLDIRNRLICECVRISVRVSQRASPPGRHLLIVGLNRIDKEGFSFTNSRLTQGRVIVLLCYEHIRVALHPPFISLCHLLNPFYPPHISVHKPWI